MKRKHRKWMAMAILMTVFIMSAAGCSKKEEDMEEEVIYPVSINGSEIIVGETTVQTLLDQGFKITVSEMTEDNRIYEYEVDSEAELEANSYYSGASIWLTDSSFASVSIVTGESSVKLGDAVIAYMEFSLIGEEPSNLSHILFNGVPINEITRDKAGEMFPDFTGDENMWFSSGTSDYKYFMAFNSDDGMMNKFSVERKYEVDWSGNN